MIKVTLKNKMFLIGKVHEVIEAIDDMIITYGKDATLLDIIEYSLKS